MMLGPSFSSFFFFNDTATTEIYTLSLHDALPIFLIARQKRAEAHKRIQETMSSIGDKSVFETFERMAEQIEHEERKLIAAAEVNEDLTGDRLVKQFQALEVKADADQQLLDLKRKMGLLTAGSPAGGKQLGKGAAEAELVEDDDAEHHR